MVHADLIETDHLNERILVTISPKHLISRAAISVQPATYDWTIWFSVSAGVLKAEGGFSQTLRAVFARSLGDLFAAHRDGF